MKNWLENLVVVSLLLACVLVPYILSQFPASILSFIFPTLEDFFQIEPLAFLYPMMLIFVGIVLSLLIYFIEFIRDGYLFKKGMKVKLRYFLPWFIYILGLAVTPYLLYLGYAGIPGELLLIPLPSLFIIIWFFVTWKIGKRISS